MCVRGGGNPSQPSRGAGACPAGTHGPYSTQNDAARAALASANPDSIRDNREYSGLIYRGADGQYYYTGPVQGTADGADPWRDAPIPAGNTEVGYYHTHGDYSTLGPTGEAVRTSDPARDDFDSDNFSADDRRAARRHGTGVPGYGGYLAGPGGTFRRYDPASGNDETF